MVPLAFAARDIAGILANVAEETNWAFNGAAPEIVPWHTRAHGKAGVQAFIESFVSSVDLEAFEPKDFVHSDDTVIAHIRLA